MGHGLLVGAYLGIRCRRHVSGGESYASICRRVLSELEEADIIAATRKIMQRLSWNRTMEFSRS